MYKIKIPKKIKVAGMDYDIQFDERNTSDGDGIIFGAMESEERIITIFEKKCDQDRLSQTFIHEVTHAIAGEIISCWDEKTVCAIAAGFHQVLEQMGVRFVK